MDYSTAIVAILTPLVLHNGDHAHDPADTLEQTLDTLWPAVQRDVHQHTGDLVRQPVSPERALAFEHQLHELLRQAGRQIVQAVYNSVEPAVQALPKHVHWESSLYTRLGRKTPQNVWTLFGQVRVNRVGYRPTDKSGEPTIFPLALALGLCHGASPALTERVAAAMSDSGATQQAVLRQLRQDHGVCWGVKKLRHVTHAVSAEMAAERHEVQTERLLAWLAEAAARTGPHKPVLSVGRDGITMPLRCQGGTVYEVASCGTVSVLDRRGRRVGTVYLAVTPEALQPTMSQQLTKLLGEVLRRWHGRLSRLSYVTDAGDNETSYYDKVLADMTHPRTGKPLAWQRVVDYYHASERLWTMAEFLFGKGQRATAWARKMQKLLLKANGARRVLHSAAALRSQQGLAEPKRKAFAVAYAFLRRRLGYLDYASYRRVGIPLGSGVTEAGCKTVFTQRLKLSGMRWQSTGAQHILNLRVLRLSGVWEQAYARRLQRLQQPQVRVDESNQQEIAKKAA